MVSCQDNLRIIEFLEYLLKEGYFSTPRIHDRVRATGRELRPKQFYLWGSVQTYLGKQQMSVEMVVVSKFSGDNKCHVRKQLESLRLQEVLQSAIDFEESKIVPGLYEGTWNGLGVSVSECEDTPGGICKICVYGDQSLVDGHMVSHSLDQDLKKEQPKA